MPGISSEMLISYVSSLQKIINENGHGAIRRRKLSLKASQSGMAQRKHLNVKLWPASSWRSGEIGSEAGQLACGVALNGGSGVA